MPKVSWLNNLKKKEQEAEIDVLMALIRYQRCSKKLSYEDLGKKTGYSAGHLRNIFNDEKRSPWDWPTETRNTVCDVLGISKEIRQQYYPG